MRRLVWATFIALLSFGSASYADNYPSHPITIVVPFAAGGPSDAMARILGERMRATLGEAVLVENVTGAGGSIGGEVGVNGVQARIRRVRLHRNIL